LQFNNLIISPDNFQKIQNNKIKCQRSINYFKYYIGQPCLSSVVSYLKNNNEITSFIRLLAKEFNIIEQAKEMFEIKIVKTIRCDNCYGKKPEVEEENKFVINMRQQIKQMFKPSVRGLINNMIGKQQKSFSDIFGLFGHEENYECKCKNKCSVTKIIVETSEVIIIRLDSDKFEVGTIYF
jgi:hypothetical protein